MAKNIPAKLPGAEFEIMKIVWSNKPPLSAGIIMEQLGKQKKWKAPTAISLLLRLTERGFLYTEKTGKERLYYPLVSRDDYLKFETENFITQYHGNSFASLISSLYDGKALSEEDLNEIKNWLDEIKNRQE